MAKKAETEQTTAEAKAEQPEIIAEALPEGMTAQGPTPHQKRMALVAAGFNEMQIKALMKVFG